MTERTVVVRDLFVALSSVVTATMTASTADGPIAWWRGATTAVGSVALFGAVDRTHVGTVPLVTMLTGVAVLLLGVAWSLLGPLFTVVPPLLFGFGVGTATNRLVFGVLYPLPEARRKRENIA